jgi:hypothetical protein
VKGGVFMSEHWLYNNRVETSLVTVEEKQYLIYVKLVGNKTPQMVKDLDTGHTCYYADVREELSQSAPSLGTDQIAKIMIKKLSENPS